MNFAFPEFTPTPALDLLAFILGLCVGSFLNVVALRSLAEESIFWPASHCPRCKHALGPLDNIPLLSWVFLRGKCRYCHGPISWQYPVVELFTGLTFLAVERWFFDLKHSPFNGEYWNEWVLGSLYPWLQSNRLMAGEKWIIDPDSPVWHQTLPGQMPISITHNDMCWLAIGALLLLCTLIAVTVTDFREKLIPHDITYPSMLIGIAFSALVRHDLLGAMAGIGASYILFDFIAFYGLKVYLSTHGGNEEAGRARRLRRRLAPRKRRRLSRALRWRVDLATIDKTQQEEPVEVMGGGDAVLSAVMAAYLGWQLLVLALLYGFIFGTLIGLIFLINEMRKANLLHKCGRQALLYSVIGATAFGCLGFGLQMMAGVSGFGMAVSTAVLGAIGGALIGVIAVGTQVSKPYPFGPALAAGGFIATFLLPNWLYLSAIAPTQH